MREISAVEFCYSEVIAFKFHRNFTYVSETYDELYIEHHSLCRFFPDLADPGLWWPRGAIVKFKNIS